MRVRTRECFGRRGYVVGSLFPYQLSLGVTVRWYDDAPHLRLYVGPFKLAVGGMRYWRHLPVIRWWSTYVRPSKCMSCGRRRRDHREECYFA